MTAIFKLSDIRKYYAEREVLHLDRLDLDKGHIHCILGPNGAGKSTLARIIALLTPNDSGHLEVLGEKINWNPSQLIRLRRRMSMVTQSSFMFEGSVYYNVAYGLKVRRYPEKKIRSTVEESLALVGMSDFIEYPARNLSGGERQKVAIARALAVRPQVLFLDEPTSNVDPGSALEIEKHIREMNTRLGTTIILITHNLFQARRLADQVYVLWEGRLLEQASCEELFSSPRDPRVRSFLAGEF